MKNIIIFGGTGFLGSWIVKNFIESGYKVTIFDLKIELELLKNLIGNDIEKIKNVSYVNSIKKSVENSDLVIIHTEWNDFKSINFKNLVKGKKFIIYDMRNIYSSSKIKSQGFKYFSVGR